LITTYEEEKVFPNYNLSDGLENYKYSELKNITKALYKAKPSIFTSLNIEQKKLFLKFLDALLESNDRENLLKIIDSVIDLSSEEKSEFLNILENAQLKNIIKTLRLIEDRYKAVDAIDQMVFNEELGVKEVPDLQKMIERHYWIFGEQYQLLTAAEPKFEEALRRYTHFLTKKDENRKIDHPDRLKEMDIFICRQNRNVDRIENIVVELKHPRITIGGDQYNQVHKYLQVIRSQPEFNASNMYWEFYLIGNKFDTTGFIENQISTNKNHGLKSLVLLLEDGRVKVFAKTWSEIFADFELKHQFLLDKLKIERANINRKYKSKKEIEENDLNNTAYSLTELVIPKN
jgi:hypothetical protein